MTRAVLVLSLALLAGCAMLSQPSASADVVERDPAVCAVEHVRLCVAQVWVYIKFHLSL